MSVFVDHPLGSVGILVVLVGLWISFRNREPENNYKLGLTVIQLSATISLLTAVRTDVGIDSWSTVDWFFGLFVAMSLLSIAFSFGIAYEMHRQKKAGAGEAQRVGTGFSPR